ncbi:efflux RND transporter permease subunit [Anaeromyxobacter sp. PSR-1]|uniref:efflux RND transporter permease subunit n=1 Tax=Anaeromyxobacter sp. PSR-1 TaxID=1300915 RepID=UPI0005DB455B|nr:efflux RND transporter permease subunit [Anaeromyxobacter sp. PSR-1]GAO04484.1 nodulation protein NolG [Anaeromyxobacter sp. PSR-1]
MDAIKTFITRPVFTAMLVLAVVVFGLNAYPKIGVDQLPDVDVPVVTVTTVLAGADPESIERDVSDPLEEALNGLAGLESMRSVNVESVSQVILQFSLETKVDVAAQDVRDRVQATLSKLPADADLPVVEKLDVGAAPILTLALSGPVPPEELTRLAEDELKPALQRQGGVGSVEVVGGRKREIRIVVDPARLRTFGVAASEVAQAVRGQSVDVPAGRAEDPRAEAVVKVSGEARSVDELRDLVVATPGGAPVRLRDVADVVDGPAEARSSAADGGRPAVALVVKKQSGANTVQVAERVTGALSSLEKLLPEGAQLRVVRDNSKFIRASIRAVEEDLILGGLLAVAIVLVFLRSWRTTIVSALALPTSVIGTFAVMHGLGYTFNVITMLALTLSIGLLIDDAIVVIENISRHAEHGAPPAKAAHAGTKEIALAVLAVTLAVLAMFVPVAFMEGIVGRFFSAFGMTVAVAVAISYLVSMTLTPMASAYVLRAHGEPGRISRAVERALSAVERFYRRVLGWALDHVPATLAIAVALLLATVALGRFLQFTFMPAQDTSELKVALELPAGTPLERTARELEALRTQLQAVPGVTHVFATAGGGVQEEVHKGELIVGMVPIRERAFSQEELKAWLRTGLRRPADATVSVQDFAAVAGGGSRPQPVQFNVRGHDWAEVVAAAEKVRAHMAASPRFSDVDSTYRPGKPQVTVRIDRDRAASLGIPVATIGTSLRAYLGGDDFAKFRQGTDSYDIRLKLPQDARGADRIGELTVRSAPGQLVELRNVATLVDEPTLSQIDRQEQLRQITLLADLPRGASLGAAMQDLAAFAAQELPQTVITDFEGQGKELGKTAGAFLQALALGIVLVYMILAAQFGSLVDPFTIMLSLPFAVIGALGALLATGQFMSIFALIGVIMLMGLVTKNGILLVEFANQLRARGRSARDALLEAGPIRLRPILMTTIAMIAGMVPVALARGDGAEMRVPMAIAIIGGLVTSTLLTLVVVPVFYRLLDRLKRAPRVELVEAPPEVERPTGT